MKVNLLGNMGDFFGLDIGTTALRLVQLKGTGPVKALSKYAYTPIDPRLSMSDSKTDHQKVAKLIQDLVSKAKISTKNVAVGLPANRVFTTVVDIDRLQPAELAKTIRFQADSLIPTPLAESKIDWALLGDSPKDKTKVEILLSSVTNEFAEARLDMLESIGLNVVAFEPDSVALTRAVVAAGSAAPQVVIDIGSKATDIVITMGEAPRLTRSLPSGAESIIKAAMQSLSIDEKQAQQFVFKFGLSKDKLEGQIYHAILPTIDTLVTEIDKSIKFFQNRYQNSKVEHIVVTGAAATLPEFPLYLANKFGLGVEIGNAWRNVTVPTEQQAELLTLSNFFGVAVGLAERTL